MGPPWGAFCQITLTSCYFYIRHDSLINARSAIKLLSRRQRGCGAAGVHTCIVRCTCTSSFTDKVETSRLWCNVNTNCCCLRGGNCYSNDAVMWVDAAAASTCHGNASYFPAGTDLRLNRRSTNASFSLSSWQRRQPLAINWPAAVCSDLCRSVCVHGCELTNEKLSCRWEAARRIVSLNVSLRHWRSLKVIRSDTWVGRV